MPVFFIGIYCLLIFFIIYALFNKLNTVFTISYILYTCLYDWILINLSYSFPAGLLLVLKSIQEVMIVAIITVFMARIAKCGKIRINIVDNLILGIILITVISIFISLVKGDGISTIIQGLRLYFIPILIPYTLYKYKCFDNLNIRTLVWFIVILSSFLVIHSFWQVFTFNGDLRSLWFYDFYNSAEKNPIDTAAYNFIRDNRLRATSIFVSSITLSVAFYVFFIIFVTTKIRLWKLWTILSVIGIELSQTRVGYFLIIISLGIYFQKKIMPRNKHYYLIPICAVITTFISLIFQITGDESALGRLVQYASFPMNFTLSGNGIGNKYALIFYDSFYISLLMGYGIFALFYIYVYYKMITIVINQNISNNNISNKTFITGNCIIALSFLYLYAFQFVAGSFTMSLVWMLIFISLSKLQQKKCITKNVTV